MPIPSIPAVCINGDLIVGRSCDVVLAPSLALLLLPIGYLT